MKSEPAEPAEQTTSTGRAGRDLSAAIIVGVSLVALIIASLYFYKDSFALIVAIALVVALFELAKALKGAKINLPVAPVLVGGLATLVASYYWTLDHTLTIFGVAVLATIIFRLPRGPKKFVRDATAGIFVLSYLFLMGTFVLRMLAEDDGEWRIVAFIACTVASDVGGYAAGVFFGKHPMAPNISPKKSWEGFAGSLITGMAVGTALVVYTLDGPWWGGVLLGAACVVMATLGDLSESLIKRDIGVKDMGTLLPGHGGIMDRLDSLIAVAPASFIVMSLVI